MRPISRLTRWKICRFWQRHKWLHRFCIVFIIIPICVVCTIPAALKGAYEEMREGLEWVFALWEQSDEPYDRWIAVAEGEIEEED